ncbi:MAG TPA: hypothetical protein VHX19_18740 [Stellaceae bacterium]|jgi:hypothetical protein|nr:hypothetical protein [Stellaceae bacterium]
MSRSNRAAPAGVMNRYVALLVFGGVGALFAAGGILLAISASMLQRDFDGVRWIAVTAYRGGMLSAVVGFCLIVIGYLEFRRR